MKCIITNSCKYKNLCCNFCDVKDCEDRCSDKHKHCRFFEDEEIDKTLCEKEAEKKPLPIGIVDTKRKRKSKSRSERNAELYEKIRHGGDKNAKNRKTANGKNERKGKSVVSIHEGTPGTDK